MKFLTLLVFIVIIQVSCGFSLNSFTKKQNSILKALFRNVDKFPDCNGTPGTLISTKNSIPIFSTPNGGDTIFAVTEYGAGKLAVFTHHHYNRLILEKNSNSSNFQFAANLRNWFGIGDENLEELIAIQKVNLFDENINNKYSIVQWVGLDVEINKDQEQKLLNFIRKGGNLICGDVPWGWLQLRRGKTLKDNSQYRFLRDNFGILFTGNYPTHMNQNITENKAFYSHFDIALTEFNYSMANEQKLSQIIDTIRSGMYQLHDEGLFTQKEMLALLDIKLVPTRTSQLTNFGPKKVIQLMNSIMKLIDDFSFKAPGINNYPGDFEKNPKLISHIELNLTSKVSEKLSTGYYLPAGVQLEVKVIEGKPNDWRVQIGGHKDVFTDKCDGLIRWPSITIEKSLKLTNNTFRIFSPFGGLIYFISPLNGDSIRVNLKNVVEAPYWDITQKPTVDHWKSRRNSPGLWAELAGDYVILTVNSKVIRNLSNPEKVLSYWDNVVKAQHELRNSSSQRRERFIHDIQTCLGLMYSGYPVVSQNFGDEGGENMYNTELIGTLDKAISIKWGFGHEFGHNFQRSEWTFDGALEITNNIYTCYAMEKVFGLNGVYIAGQFFGNLNTFKGYFNKSPTYNDWKKRFDIGLLTFMQLVKHFGWNSMKSFFSGYEYDILNRRDRLPKSNQEKIDQWVLRYSRIVNRNIRPQFLMWGLPVSESVDDQLAGLEKFLPDEEKNPNIFFSGVPKFTLSTKTTTGQPEYSRKE